MPIGVAVCTSGSRASSMVGSRCCRAGFGKDCRGTCRVEVTAGGMLTVSCGACGLDLEDGMESTRAWLEVMLG